MASKAPHNLNPVTNTIGTTRYEQASAMLSSILLLLGVVTTGMFVAWLSATVVWNRPSPPVNLEDVGGGSFGDSRTGSKELVEPGADEVKELAAIEKVELALETIASLVSTEVASDSTDSLDQISRRKVGPPGPGPLIGNPAWERWEIKFSPTGDIDLYAQQLDFFKVELGVAGGGIEVVDYCSHFSAATPSRRAGAPKDERRLYFLCKEGNVREADCALARKAGIDVSDRVVFQFYTQEMYKNLLILENERMRAANKRIIEVKKTTFGVRGAPGRWEFYILDQKYRPPLPIKS